MNTLFDGGVKIGFGEECLMKESVVDFVREVAITSDYEWVSFTHTNGYVVIVALVRRGVSSIHVTLLTS
jgi:hypothetical protein